MINFAKVMLNIIIAIFAAYSWCFVYPYAGLNHYGDVLLAAFFVLFWAALFLTPLTWKKYILSFSIISSLAGVVTTVWIVLSWRLGIWFPSFPDLLHQLFSTDGESSYNATDGQLFLTLFVLFSIIYLIVYRYRRK